MVNPNESELNLHKVFAKHPEMIARYLFDVSRTAVILLDKEGKILDCNPFFLDNLLLSDKPIGQKLDHFLEESLPMTLGDAGCDFQTIRLSFSLNQCREQVLSGHWVRIDDGYVVFASSLHLTDHELVAAISKLNDELTDITRELNKKNRELEAANETITRLMNMDPLTGLTNRRHFAELLKREISMSKRHRWPLSAVMADIDHFKIINDTYGHDVGDRVLVSVANVLKQMSRQEDIVARYGGEEFVLVLPNSTVSAAFDCAERMRQAIAKLQWPEIKQTVTASFGVAPFLPEDTADRFIKKADQALYQAKMSGRNRIALSAESGIDSHPNTV